MSGFDGYGAHWWIKPSQPEQKKVAKAPPPPEPEPIPEPRPASEVIAPNGKPVRTGLSMVGGVAQNTGTPNIPKPSSGNRDSIDAWLDGPVGQGAMRMLSGQMARGESSQPPPFQPTLAPLRPAAEQAMGAIGAGFNAVAGAAREAGDGAIIRMAQAMRQGEQASPGVRTTPAVRQVMEHGLPPEQPEQQAPAMNDRRAQYLRNDFLRRMAIRHEDQLAKAGMGYEHLEQEYDSGQGGHYDRAASMTQGLLNRLRTAREMDSAKRVKDFAQQDNMARRLGVHRAGVIFHNDLQNAQTPEDRIRVALSYHAMFPELGLGNMAAMMASQQGENQNLQTAGEMQSREADAQRAFAAQEAAAQRAFSGQEGGEDRQFQIGMGLQQQGFDLQKQHNAMGWQNSMMADANASNLAAAKATAEGQARGMIGQGSDAARYHAQLAQMQSPLSQMMQGQQMIAGSPVGQVVPQILADHAMRGGLPDPASQSQAIVSSGAGRAAQVANQRTYTSQDKAFLSAWTRALLNNRPASQATYTEWASALGMQSSDPRARQLWFALTGVNAGGAMGAIGDAMRGMNPIGAAGAMMNPAGAAAAAAFRSMAQ